MTKERAEQARRDAITAVNEAQAKLGHATNDAERATRKKELQDRLAELARAKAKLREVNLLLSSGAKPIETEQPAVPTSTEELAAKLIESFDQLLRIDPGHPAIRALKAHFEALAPKPVAPVPLVRLPPPRPLRQRGKVPFLDARGRQSGGPGTTLYYNRRD
jgi:hypothetical protein